MAAARALVTRQRERRDQGPSVESAGGRPREGKNHLEPSRGLRRAELGRRRFPGRSCPLPAAPRVPSTSPLTLAPSRLLGKPGRSRTFRWGASWGRGGRAGAAGAPGCRRWPAWAQLGTRRWRRRAWPWGRGSRAAGGLKAAAEAAATGYEPGRGADRPRGRRGAGRRRCRRDPGATCWRSAAAAIPGGPGRRHPLTWPRARPEEEPEAAAPSYGLAGLPPGVLRPAPRGSRSGGAAARWPLGSPWDGSCYK